MTAPAWYNEGKKLNEGASYPFSFIKLIPLSDHMNYMLMEDPYGIRHLVPYEYYLSYNLLPGTVVHCRVDKINCTGRVFLEPEHPVYSPGSVAGFKVAGIRKHAEKESERKRQVNIEVFIVEDVFGNEIEVDIPDGHITMPLYGTINCRIDGFKKGKPLLSLPVQESKPDVL